MAASVVLLVCYVIMVMVMWSVDCGSIFVLRDRIAGLCSM